MAFSPGATPAEIKAAILAGVDPVPLLTGLTLTGGRLNAYNTLLNLSLMVRAARRPTVRC